MKFVPRHTQVVGRIVVKKRASSQIVRPDETKGITKFVLIDALGPEAEASGLKVGDIVLPQQISNVVLEGGTSFRPMFDEREIKLLVRELDSSEMMIQTDNAANFVPYDSPDAAKSLGAST